MNELLGHASRESLGCSGRRTAELHMALSSRADIPEFAPEPFTEFYRHGLYHGMLGEVNRAFDALRSRMRQTPSRHAG